MAKHVVRACYSGGQLRLTIPKVVVRRLGWENVRYLLVREEGEEGVWVRRFMDGESLESDGKRDPLGSDR